MLLIGDAIYISQGRPYVFAHGGVSFNHIMYDAFLFLQDDFKVFGASKIDNNYFSLLDLLKDTSGKRYKIVDDHVEILFNNGTKFETPWALKFGDNNTLFDDAKLLIPHIINLKIDISNGGI